MTPEIEKVARAIADKAGPGWHYDACFDMARAAIEAMREPTQRMRDAAARKGWNPEGGQDIEECWPAMIDAALAEPPK